MSKACEWCECEFNRPPGRTDAAWAARRFCSHVCARASRAANDGLADRLWRRVEKLPSGCWEWRGYIRPAGYGQIGTGEGKRTIDTHRLSWILRNGPIPDGLFVCHRCDNPPCVNPDHLFLGTHRDNVADMVAKGRNAKGDRLPHTRLTDEQVREIRARYVARWSTPRRGGRRSNAPELATEFGISPIYVQQLAHGMYRKDA